MSDVRYFIDGRWQSKGDLVQGLAQEFNGGQDDPYVNQWADQIIQDYEHGANSYGLRRDPSTGTVIPFEHTYDEANPPPDPYWTGEDYAPIEMSGGFGTDTLMGEGKLLEPASAHTNKVDSRLVDVARQAAEIYPDYSVAVTSHGGRNGRRSTPNHPGGFALDFELTDLRTGEVLDNLNDPRTFRAYEGLAQTMKSLVDQQYPELSPVARFGGYFRQGVSFDQMHFDITPNAKGNMAYGSWEYGLGQDAQGNSIKLPSRYRGPGISVGMLEGAEIPTGLPSTLPASRVASELNVAPSWPSPQEAVQMLAERGYTGPDAALSFQQNELLSTHPSGNLDAETVAALMNPNPILPTERPPVMMGSTGLDSYRGGTDTLMGGIGSSEPSPPADGGVSIAPNLRPNWARGLDATTNFQKPPDLAPAPKPLLPNAGAGLGAVTPRNAPRGLPAPGARPAGLGAAGQELPGSYRRLRVGDSGPDVRAVQSQLVAAGFDPGPIDGAYGPKTAAAVMAFQRTDPERVGGKVDAIAGPFTQAALFDFTQNSAISSLHDPEGVPRGSPSGFDVAAGLGRAPTAPAAFDPGGGTGRDSRPPGTVPAGEPIVRRDLGPAPLSSGDRSMILNQRFSPMEGQAWKPWGSIPVSTVRETPLQQQQEPSSAGLVGGVAPAGSREPSPLSPANVIATMGGTGSSGLGPAGPGSAGVSDSTWSSDPEDDPDNISGYNESFSTTGWL